MLGKWGYPMPRKPWSEVSPLERLALGIVDLFVSHFREKCSRHAAPDWL